VKIRAGLGGEKERLKKRGTDGVRRADLPEPLCFAWEYNTEKNSGREDEGKEKGKAQASAETRAAKGLLVSCGPRPALPPAKII